MNTVVTTTERKCSSCQNYFPLSEFATCKPKNKPARPGSYCKPCSNRKLRQKWLDDRAYRERKIIRTNGISLAKRGVPGEFTLSEWQTLYSNQGSRCSYCGQYSENLWIDHVLPVSLYNSNDPLAGYAVNNVYNIVPACSFCNRAKGATSLIAFLHWKYHLQEETNA